MKRRRSAGFAAGLLLAAVAWADEAALRREAGAVDRRFDAELRQVEQRFARARIQLESTTREKVAAAQRELEATAMQAIAGLSRPGAGDGAGGLSGLAQTAAASFAQAEAQAELDYWLLPELAAAEAWERARAERRRAFELAQVQARHLEDGEDGEDAARRQMEQAAQIEQRWGDRLDQLEHDRALAAARVEREIRRLENQFNRDLQSALLGRADALPPGGIPGVLTDPAVQALQAKRDEAVNALRTRLDETQLDFDTRRSELEAGRDEEMARLYEGG